MAKQDLSKLFAKAKEIKAKAKSGKAGLFDKEILNASAEALKSGKPLNVKAFYEMAKLGSKNDDDIHLPYYVKRAIKMALIEQDKKAEFPGAFNSPEHTAKINKILNAQAIKSQSVILEDGSEDEQIIVDYKNLYN